MPNSHDERARLVDVPLTLGRDEVEELWHFVHGDIMEPGIRGRLRRSMGLCARRSWAYAQVEIELWQQGVGTHSGHQPFDVAILYEDLLGEALDRLNSTHLPWHEGPAWSLRAAVGCWICAATGRAPYANRPSHGFAGSNTDALTEEANAGVHLRAWIARTSQQWRSRACPACGAASAPTPLVCRPHLMQQARLEATQRAAIAARLTDLQTRLQLFIASLTDGGPSATPPADASWLETIAWFTGWPTQWFTGRSDPPPRQPQGG